MVQLVGLASANSKESTPKMDTHPSLREFLNRILGDQNQNLIENIENKIIEDPLYLHHLLVVKDDDELLAVLLRSVNMKNDLQAPALGQQNKLELVQTAIGALAGWAKDSFRLTPNEESQRRLSICQSCPHRKTIPVRGIYKLLSSHEEEDVCNLCGCLIRRKVALNSEICPDVEYHHGRGRWVIF